MIAAMIYCDNNNNKMTSVKYPMILYQLIEGLKGKG